MQIVSDLKERGKHSDGEISETWSTMAKWTKEQNDS